MAALDEAKTDADQHQPDHHRRYSLKNGRPGDLIETQGGNRDYVSEHRCRVLNKHRPQRGVRGDPGLLEELSVVTVGPGCHLTCRPANRHQIEDGREREDNVGDEERGGRAGMDQFLDALANENAAPPTNTPRAAMSAQK